jgi:hypothetical protein
MLFVYHPLCETAEEQRYQRERDLDQTPWPRRPPRTLRSHPYDLRPHLLGAFGQRLPKDGEWRSPNDDDSKEARSLRYRRSSTTTNRRARREQTSEEPFVDVNALASADTALLLATTNFQGGRAKIAESYNRAFVLFESEVRWPLRCGQCGELYTSELAGTLSCAIHPYLYVNHANNTVGYTVAQPPPTPCLQCAEQHLVPSLRCTEVHENLRFGCTPVDHAASVRDLLARPFVAVPAIFWELLVLSKNPEYADLDVLVREPDAHRGVLLVHSPDQLTRILKMHIPGTAHEYKASVAAIYEQLASKFGIQSLATAVYSARAGTAQSSISKMAQFVHVDAERRDSLRRLQRKQARFAPFVIIARLSQRGGRGMVLE